MFNNISYNVIIERFKVFASGHYLIKRFTHGQVDQTDLDKDQQFPWMHVAPVEVRAAAGARVFTFDVIFADIPRDKEDKTDYQKESISDCIRLAEDLLSEIQNGLTVFGTEVEIEGESTLTPFIEEWTHTLSGCTLALTISVPNNYSACDIPADWAIGGGSPSTPPSPLPGIILRVNSIDNVNQHLLDLTAGANITITDLGDGRVQFDATGDIGTNWGTIGGLLSNQLDLQAALDLKADITSLGAVAFSNDYNDLDNLPGTPTLQTVTDAGNSTTNDIDFGTGAGVYFANGARVKEGTTDANNGGVKGVALKCSIDYELKWEAGRLYVMEQNGTTIREVSHNFAQVPTSTDDNTKGFVIGSRWILDNGDVYECTNASTGAAVWTLVPVGTGTVTSVGLSVPAPVNAAFSVTGSPVTTSGTLAINANGTSSQYVDGTGALQTMPTGLPPTGAAGGDLSGTYPNPNVDRIHGIDMQSGTPSAGEVWLYEGSPAKWQHQHLPAIHVTNDSAVTGSSVKDALNHLNTTKVESNAAITAGTSTKVTYDAKGLITSGTTLSATDIPSGVDATKIGAGTVSNTEFGYLDGVTSALQTQLNTKVDTTRTISTTSPLSGGGDLSANRTLSIADAVADGSTKGAAAFTASDFNSASGVISIDYTNGQKASALQPGFLTAADYSTFSANRSDYFTFRCALGPVSPGDATTYYIATTTPSLSASATLYRNTAPYACKLVGAEIQATNTVTNATNEASTFNFRLNNTTDVLLSNAVIVGGTVAVSNTYTVTGLNQTIAAGDTFNIKWTTPTWVTNPTSVVIAVTLFFERT